MRLKPPITGNRDFTGIAAGREGTERRADCGKNGCSRKIAAEGTNARKPSQGNSDSLKLVVMSTSSPTTAAHNFDAIPPVTLVQLADRFGDIPATRICLNPPPGQATEADMLHFQEHEDRLFELVDGTLIEKTMGNFESQIASTIHGLLFIYLRSNPLGLPLLPDTQLKLRRGAIRLPDVGFLSHERARQSGDPRRQKVAAVAPNLAIEVISEGNSKKEMDDKLQEYFRAGTEEVWYVYPETRELHQFTSPTDPQIWQGDAQITTRLLPGFTMNLAEIFQAPGE